MLNAIVALSLTPIAYGLTPGKTTPYYIRIGLNGFLPVLGGKQGSAQVDLTVNVQGLQPDPTGDSQASSDLTDFHVKFNGAEFPVDLETAKNYFPKNTVAFTPLGHVDKNDAPDIQLPVHLPGLDPKRFPDISYLPIEFPVGGVEEGKSWSFKKPFEGVDLNYTITPTHVDDDQVQMKIDLTQHDEYFEDGTGGVITDPKNAADKVVSDLSGGGTATFDRKRNLVSAVSIKMQTVSKATDLQTKKETPRMLDTTLDVSVDKPLPLLLVNANRGSGPLDLLRDKIQQSAPIQRALIASQLVHPRGGSWRNALPLVRSAVNNIHVPSQGTVRGQVENLAVLARNTASRVPELLNVQSVQRVGSFLSSIPSVLGSHWSPNYEGAEGLADKLVQYIAPDDMSAYRAAGVRWHKNQHKPSLPASGIKPRG